MKERLKDLNVLRLYLLIYASLSLLKLSLALKALYLNIHSTGNSILAH